MVAIMIIILVLPLAGVGIFLIVGSLRNVDYLVTLQNYGIFSGIYPLLDKFGRQAIKVYHIIVGVVVLSIAFKLLLYFLE